VHARCRTLFWGKGRRWNGEGEECWMLVAHGTTDPSRRGARARCVGMRGSLWLSMTRKWVFPHPIIQRSHARMLHSVVDRACSRTAIGPAAFASRVKSGRMKLSGLTHREPTWKDTNAPVRACGYNKSSACMCAEKLRVERRMRERHASACMRACVSASEEITRNLWRRLPDQSLVCVRWSIRFNPLASTPVSRSL